MSGSAPALGGLRAQERHVSHLRATSDQRRRPPSKGWRLVFVGLCVLAVVAATLTWMQVVSRLRAPEPVAARGTPAAIVWSDRVFHTEAELASYLRRRGVDYERWARTHPAAVGILRPGERARAAQRPRSRAVAPAAAQPRSRPEPTAGRDSGARVGTPAWVALVVLAVVGLLATAALASARPSPARRYRLSLRRLPLPRPRVRGRRMAVRAAAVAARERLHARRAVPAGAAARRPTPSTTPAAQPALALHDRVRGASRPARRQLLVSAVSDATGGASDAAAEAEMTVEAPPGPQAVAAPALPGWAAQTVDGQLASRVPVAARAPDAPPSSGTGTQECEVRLWRGYVKSQFCAVTTIPGQGEVTVGESPFFRWRRHVLPPDVAPAVEALRGLVDALERDGWTVAGRGDDWFAVRLRIDEADPVEAPTPGA